MLKAWLRVLARLQAAAKELGMSTTNRSATPKRLGVAERLVVLIPSSFAAACKRAKTLSHAFNKTSSPGGQR